MADRPERDPGAARARPPRHSRWSPEAERLRARFHAHLRATNLIPPGTPVLVALSGGVDSCVLLHLLCFDGRHPPTAGGSGRISAAHLDHGMRPDSAADASWVRGMCRAWGVPLVSRKADPPPRTEAQARGVRYAFLEEAAAQAGAELIATGHHLDDQAETILFRAARGAGLRGLRGILSRRGMIVRPLLPFTRAEIVAYARAVGLRWREDPSNASARYARNRVRGEVLPVLERIVPGAARALAGLAAHARRAEHGWDSLLDALAETVVTAEREGRLEVARERLLAYPSEVQGRLLRHLLRRHGFAPGWAGTRAAVEFISSGASGGGLALAGGVRLEREFDRILVCWPGVASEPEERPALLDRPSGEAEVVIGGRTRSVRWCVTAQPPDPAAEQTSAEAFDAEAVCLPLELRGWRPGDRIRVAGGTKKLKKLFVERRIGRRARARAAVLAQPGGRVLWVVGIARACDARPVPGRPALQVTVIHVGR